MTLEQLAEELNKHNQDRDIGLYTVCSIKKNHITAHKTGFRDGYFLPREDAEELLKSYKEGK